MPNVLVTKRRVYSLMSTHIVMMGIEMAITMRGIWAHDSGFTKLDVTPGGGGIPGVVFK